MMDSCHVGMRPRKNVMVLSECTLDIPSLFECQEGADVCEMSDFLRDLDCFHKGSATGGSLFVGFSNCYWSGTLASSESGLPSLLGPISRAI